MVELINHTVKPVPWKNPSYFHQMKNQMIGIIYFSWPFSCLTTLEKSFLFVLFPSLIILMSMGIYSYVLIYLKFALVLAYQYGYQLYLDNKQNSPL